MSNKTKLQENNASLQSVMTAVSNIPLPEDMKHGLYVWKKYSNNPREKYTITATQNSTGKTINFYMDSNEIDLTTVTVDFWIGTKLSKADTSYYLIYDATTAKHAPSATAGQNTGSFQWVAAEKRLKIWFTDVSQTAIEEWTVNCPQIKPSEFVDYVVSDNENAYPNGGTQENYWYERVSEGADLSKIFSKFDVQEFIVTSDKVVSAIQIPHNLKQAPKLAMLRANIDDFEKLTGDVPYLYYLIQDVIMLEEIMYKIPNRSMLYCRYSSEVYNHSNNVSTIETGGGAYLGENYIKADGYMNSNPLRFRAGVKYTACVYA